MLPEQTATRSVEQTPDGIRVVLRAPAASVVSTTVIRLITIGVGGYLLRAALRSLSGWESQTQLQSPFHLLQLLERTDGTVRAILYAAVVIAGYAFIGGIVSLLSAWTRRDVVLIQPGQWTVERRIMGIPRKSVVELHERVALEFDSFDHSLVARTPSRKLTVASLGTAEDREWLKGQLDRAGTVSSLQNIEVGASRVIRTVRLNRRPDGSLVVSDTKASRFGCPILMTLVVSGLIAAAVRTGDGEWWAFVAFLGVVTLLMWLSSNDHREATVTRGSIHAVTHSFLKRLGGKSPRTEVTSRAPVLYLEPLGTSTVELRTVSEESGYPLDVTILKITGNNPSEDAMTILKAISEASGFPILSAAQARDWKDERIEAIEAKEARIEQAELEETADDDLS